MHMQSAMHNIFWIVFCFFKHSFFIQTDGWYFLFSFSSMQLMDKIVNQLIHVYSTVTGHTVILIKILLCTAADITEKIFVPVR